MRERGIVVVLAKAPRAGFVKTRMTPPLSREEAAGLYAALLHDVLRVTADFAVSLDLAAVLAVAPADACAEMARRAPPRFVVSPQRGPDLAARMGWAVRECAAAGHTRVLLRGSDSPTLDGETLELAFRALDDAELVLCPDLDGGYNLVGLRAPAPGLFDHPMSTSSVLEHTLANAERLGLRARVLPHGFDVDRASDLRRLADLRDQGAGALCPRALAYCDEHDLWRHAAAAGGG